jgi:hypothetical protein
VVVQTIRKFIHFFDCFKHIRHALLFGTRLEIEFDVEGKFDLLLRSDLDHLIQKRILLFHIFLEEKEELGGGLDNGLDIIF